MKEAVVGLGHHDAEIPGTGILEYQQERGNKECVVIADTLSDETGLTSSISVVITTDTEKTATLYVTSDPPQKRMVRQACEC